ncbi:DUF4317 family protein [Allobaculum mucilyticum]|uniref:DUF4317 family protein n=1 Tax=Allobaculum mucilyticum TaxID=2834459 RepID=UPI001E4B25EC|nr:DUF4317 family protein [Allobaculum mucilyticum]UNT96422.1 DUF4317 domain-containing protein [Allobaculum mucilyticum]
MNKKELQEIRRQLKPENERLHLKGIMEAYGKFKDTEASIQFCRRIDPETLSTEEEELYYEIFKKSLGGTPGKNLVEYGFDSRDPAAVELKRTFFDYKDGALLREETFESFAQEMIEKGNYRNSVYLTAGIFEYSAPNLNANREETEGNSTYRFMIVSVSEARLTQIGLYYSTYENSVQRKVNEEMQIIPSPLDAFLYPIFSDRASDVNHLLYHSKTAKNPNIDLIEQFFHVPFQSTGPEQSEGFAQVIEEVFPEGLDFKTAMNLHRNLADYIAEESEEEAVVKVDKNRMRDLLDASGARSENLEHFDSAYTRILEDQELAAINLLEKGKVSMKSPLISISVKDDGLDQIRTQIIDGKSCLVIEISDELQISNLPATVKEPAREVVVVRPEDAENQNPEQ